MLRKLVLTPLLAISLISFGQRGKHNSYTVSSLNTQLNAYTDLTANAVAGSTTITVTSNTLTNSFFSSTPSPNLGPGDLIMIIQMQGATMDINTDPAASWGSNYTLSQSAMNDLANMNNYRSDWGAITNYNNAGKYELAEVRSISGTTSITLNCALTNSYTVSGHVQVVRVPRLTSLTLNANTSIVPSTWNGTTGGIVALEVDGAVTFGNNSKISASGFGFRGGIVDNVTPASGPAGNATDVGKPGVTLGQDAAEKGEGIGGYTTEYTALYSRYGMGAPANGGGGGNFRNAGGGGGCNVGSGTYNGKGVPNVSYATNWNLESAGMSASPSSGGGRGGYSLAQTDANENTVGPNQNGWGGDYRRTEGGLGGHALTAAAGKAFMGGGGGAGEQDVTLQGGSGGNGGGIVFLQLYGAVTGTGTVEANGANGQNSNPNNQTAGTGQKKGSDGAGGAGGGGAIIISNGTALPGTLTLNATGGNGGNNALTYGAFTSGVEADGPGGGGGGGQISVTSGTAVQSVAGGTNGIVTASGLTNIVNNFPPNGATSGASGITNTSSFFDITASNVSICSGNTATLNATVSGTLPGGSSVTWYSAQFGGSVLGSGTTFTTPTLTTTTTYYVGTCPGTFRKPVVVTVGGPTISGTAVVTNATCSTAGSITGLTTSGGVPTVTITWNGVVTPTMNLANASAGTYTVTVTDGVGCTATSGPYTISTTGGPTVNTTNMVVTNETCLGNDGSITGITASGTGLTYSWTGGGSSLNYTNLTAGNYTLTVTDNNGCTATAGPITVATNPGPSISSTNVVITNETCSNANGSILGLTASGTGLTYVWNGTASAGLDHTGLSAGAYTLTVTDNLGCTATYGPVNITNSAGPTLNFTNQVNVDEHCGQADGSISGIQIVGGTPTYTVSWNSGAYNTLDISGLQSGAYTLTVSDFNGCSVTGGPFNLNDLAGPTINTTNMVITNESCAGNDGSITGITASGTGLTYQWNTVSYPSADLTNQPAGTYALVVTDQFGCFAASGPHVIGSSAAMTLDSSNLVITPAGCTTNTGAIEGLVIVGGVNPQFSWNNSSPTLDNTGLDNGTYTITVTDDQQCSITASFTVGTSLPPVISTAAVTYDSTHCNQNDGAIYGLIVSGGTTPYVYQWDGNSSLNTLDLLNTNSGNHTFLVTDDGGCTATTTLNVPALSGPVIATNTVTYDSAHCNQNDGAVYGISVTGGVEPYSYEWDGNAALNTLDLLNVDSGQHTIIVTDDVGCTATATVTVPALSGPSIDVSGMTVTNATCGQNNGTISGIQVTGDQPISYSWTGTPLTSLDVYNLGAGSYTLTVTDANGCQAMTSAINITTTPGPIADFTINPSLVLPNTVVTFTDASTGATVTNWQWFTDGAGIGVASTATYTYTVEGDYTITLIVQSAAGCTDTITKTITVYGELIIPNVLTRNNDQTNDIFEIKNLKPNTKLVVENRWGNVVYETENYKNDWNGTDMAGERLIDGTYFYQLITVEGKVWQGNVYLLNH